MNKFIGVLLTFGVATFTLNLRADDGEFNKLKSLYEKARPARLSDFLSQTDASIRNWQCAGMSEGGDELTPEETMAVHAKISVVVKAAKAAAGPEFPAQPEVRKIIDGPLFVALDGSELRQEPFREEDLTNTINYAAHLTPTVWSSFDNDFGHVTMTFRVAKGYLMFRSECAPNANYSSCTQGFEYNYCWKKPATK